MNFFKKILKNIKGSGIAEKIMVTAFAVAAGGAVIVYTKNVIIDAQSRGISGLLNDDGYIDRISESEGTSGLVYGRLPGMYACGGDCPNIQYVYGYEGDSAVVKVPSTHGKQHVVESCTYDEQTDTYNCERDYIVAGILYNAFENNEIITTVALPNSVSTIGDSAFRNCHNLNQVVISSSTSGIGAYAFACTGIKSINIPSTCGVIRENAFLGCSDDLVINVDLPSKPNNWADNWNAGHTVNWNGSSMPSSFPSTGVMYDYWSGGTVVGPAEPADPEPQTEYALWLTSAGPQKLKVVKYVKEHLGYALKEAKNLVDNCPCCLKENLNADEATTHRDALIAIGATAELR